MEREASWELLLSLCSNSLLEKLLKVSPFD